MTDRERLETAVARALARTRGLSVYEGGHLGGLPRNGRAAEKLLATVTAVCEALLEAIAEDPGLSSSSAAKASPRTGVEVSTLDALDIIQGYAGTLLEQPSAADALNGVAHPRRSPSDVLAARC